MPVTDNNSTIPTTRSTTTTMPRYRHQLEAVRQFLVKGLLRPGCLTLDMRSLALFRIGLSLYLWQDIVGRFYNGLTSLSFYTSYAPIANGAEEDYQHDETTSLYGLVLSWLRKMNLFFFDYTLPPMFDPNDTFDTGPGGPYLEDIICYRGTATVQIMLFTIHTILVFMFGFGWFGHSSFLGMNAVPTLLWLSTVSLVCRTPEGVQMTDVGDTLGHLHVMWCIFIPRLNSIWGIDAYYLNSDDDSHSHDDNNKDIIHDDHHIKIKDNHDNKVKIDLDDDQELDDQNNVHQNGSLSCTSSNNGLLHRRPNASVQTTKTTTTTTETSTLHQDQKNQSNDNHESTSLPPPPPPPPPPVQGLPALAVTMQITIIYVGLILGRLDEPAWWDPNYSCVYLAFNTLMYTRPILSEWSRQYYWVTQLMTRGTIVAELFCPVLCFLCPYDVYYDNHDDIHDGNGNRSRQRRILWKSWRHVPALMILSFHLILWACIRIPALQILFAIQTVVWIPGSFWDDLGITGREQLWLFGLFQRKKQCYHEKQARTGKSSFRTTLRFLQRVASQLVLLVLIITMLLNYFLATGFGRIMKRRGRYTFPGRNTIIRADRIFRRHAWVRGFFNPLADRLRIDQSWGIFNHCPRTAHGVVLTAVYDGAVANAPRKDLLAVMRTSDWSNNTDITFEQFKIRSAFMPVNQSAQFGHWRWEALYTEMPITNFDRNPQDVRRLEMIHDFFCAWGNQEMARRNDPRRLTDIELVFQFADITMHDEGPERFRRISDIVLDFKCPLLIENGTMEFPDSSLETFNPYTFD